MDNTTIKDYLRRKIQRLKDIEERWKADKASKKQQLTSLVQREMEEFSFLDIAYNVTMPFTTQEQDNLQPAPWSRIEEIIEQDSLSCHDIIKFNSLYQEREQHQQAKENNWEKSLLWYEGRATLLGIQTGLTHQLLKERLTNMAESSNYESMSEELSNVKLTQTEESAGNNTEQLYIENNQLKKKNKIVNSKLSELTKNVRKLEQEKERSKRTVEAMERCLKNGQESVQRDLDECRQLLAQKDTTLNETLQANQELLEQRDHLQSMNKDLTEEVENLKRDLLRKEHMVNVTRETIMELNKEIYTMEAEMKKLKKDTRSKKGLQTECGTCQAVKQTLKEEKELNQALQNKISDLEVEIVKNTNQLSGGGLDLEKGDKLKRSVEDPLPQQILVQETTVQGVKKAAEDQVTNPYSSKAPTSLWNNFEELINQNKMAVMKGYQEFIGNIEAMIQQADLVLKQNEALDLQRQQRKR